MAQIHNIKYLRQFKVMTLRGIAKETGHDFRTVKKYVEKEDFNDHPKKRKKEIETGSKQGKDRPMAGK